MQSSNAPSTTRSLLGIVSGSGISAMYVEPSLVGIRFSMLVPNRSGWKYRSEQNVWTRLQNGVWLPIGAIRA